MYYITIYMRDRDREKEIHVHIHVYILPDDTLKDLIMLTSKGMPSIK